MKNLTKYSLILKHLLRKGWQRKDISTPETVASHSWNMALLALYLSNTQEKDYNFDKVIKLLFICLLLHYKNTYICLEESNRN